MEEHKHHFMLPDSTKGPWVRGVCSCGESRVFYNSVDYAAGSVVEKKKTHVAIMREIGIFKPLDIGKL